MPARAAAPTVVTGLALATSLGVDAVSACAAARAGLVRPALLPVVIPNADTLEPEPVVGHPVPGLAAGFAGVGRLLRLLDLALDDLAAQVPPETLASATWLVAFPEAPPPQPPPDLLPEDAPDAPPPEPSAPRLTPEAVRRTLARVTGAPLPADRLATFEGRAGFIRAMGHAAQLASAGKTAIVGALDSLVDGAVVRAMAEHGRLAAPGERVGFQPGEAAAFVVVAPGGTAGALGRIGGGALAHEPAHLYSGRPALGRALAEAVGRLPGAGALWPVSDCNGEVWRSAEWGHAAVRHEALRESVGRTLYPATAVGETGAASAAVGLAFALRAFARGYAPSPTALLLAADALGPRGALLVHAP